MIIAVDFDGTIVEHKYPAIGKEIPFAIETLKKLQQERHFLNYGAFVKVVYWKKRWSFVVSGDWNFMQSIAIMPKRKIKAGIIRVN